MHSGTTGTLKPPWDYVGDIFPLQMFPLQMEDVGGGKEIKLKSKEEVHVNLGEKRTNRNVKNSKQNLSLD